MKMKAKDNKKQNAEMIKEKSSFVFYRSYFEAIETLSKKNRLVAYEAIAKYALYREETMDLPLRVLAILRMAMPNIDATHEKYFRKISQTSKADTSVIFEDECAEKILLPEIENKLRTENDLIENNDWDTGSENDYFEP
jgi:hypothetical protein